MSSVHLPAGDGAYSYVAYGARIGSYLPLPQLVAAEPGGPHDVEVRRGRIGDVPFDRSRSDFQCQAVNGEIWIHCGGVGTFRIREGRSIDVEPDPDARESALRSYIVKAALAAALRQQGKLILHASAVVLHGAAAAFVGVSGAGKSTTTAALHARGHALLADDLVAVDLSDSQVPLILPGTPQIALHPESARAIGDDPGRLPLVAPHSPKHTRDAGDAFAPAPAPLRRVYVLAESETTAITPMARDAAFGALVVHTFGRRVFQPEPDAAHFLQVASLIRAVPVKRLERRRDLAALADLARLIEHDIAVDG